MYAVQNDTETKFNIVLYVYVLYISYLPRDMGGFIKGLGYNCKAGTMHWQSKRDPRAKQGFGWVVYVSKKIATSGHVMSKHRQQSLSYI